MTFNDWLKRARRTEDPAGDFIGDAQSELAKGRFPAITSASQLMTFLVSRGASNEAIATVPDVWKRYLRARRDE